MLESIDVKLETVSSQEPITKAHRSYARKAKLRASAYSAGLCVIR